MNVTIAEFEAIRGEIGGKGKDWYCKNGWDFSLRNSVARAKQSLFSKAFAVASDSSGF